MNNPLLSVGRSVLTVLVVAGAVAAPSLALGAPVASAFELPRIKSNRQRGEIPAVQSRKYDIDDLQPQGTPGARRASNAGVDHLVLDGGRDLSRTLRGAPGDLVYVSVLLAGSDGTTIEVAGAKLAITTRGLNNSAKVLLGDSPAPGSLPRDLGKTIAVEKFGGNLLATLPLLTLRIDPAAKTWDVFLFDRMVASDLPLANTSGGGAKKLTLHAGSQGALLCGLVVSDENPLFIDANGNGIDDKFEKQANGALLAGNAPASARTTLLDQWRTEQAKSAARPWTVRRPLPDR